MGLRNNGLKVLVLDRAVFPRPKTCGDAVPGRAIKILSASDAGFGAAFAPFPKKLLTKRTTLHYGGRVLTFEWVREAYTCARTDFDHILVQRLLHLGAGEVRQGEALTSATRVPAGFSITTSAGNTMTTRLLIGADGAKSAVAAALAPRKSDRDHLGASVRAYFDGLHGLDPYTTLVFFHKRLIPSYLWIFPLPNGRANVGVGMLSSELVRRRLNLKEVFYDFLNTLPEVRALTAGAVQLGKLEGYSLPFGSAQVPISGDGFMLAGDAASLVDPGTGDGIGNAVLSGHLAAQTALEGLKLGNTTAGFLMRYDHAVARALNREFRTHYFFQKALQRHPALLSAAFRLYGFPPLNKLVKKLL